MSDEIYIKGTNQEMDDWDALANAAQGIPAEGKIGYCCDKLVPDNQRTMTYSPTIPHPTIPDSNIKPFGQYPDLMPSLTKLTKEQAIAEGFIPSEE